MGARVPALVLSGVLVAVGAHAGDPPEFGSGITLVTVPVFVTDGQGRAVPGLTASDFEVREDGKVVPVVGFREIDAASATPDDSGALSPALRRQFLLLFDLSFSSVSGLVRSREAALDFVTRTMAPGDLGAVATFSANHGVRLLVAFTPDRAQLRKAIRTLGVTQLDRRADPLGLAYDLTELGGALADTLPDESGNAIADQLRAVQMRYVRSQEAQYRQNVLALLGGMEELASALDRVQGRKQVVLLSNGFADTALAGETGRQAMKDSEAVVAGRHWEVQSDNRFGDAQVRQQLKAMVERFAASDALVHTVDLSGLSAAGDTRFAGSDPARTSGRESLSEIASLSGGRIFKDTNDLGTAFDEIAELSRRYYVLAFQPGATGRPGRFHKVRVRAARKGLEVSHRSGYHEPAAFAERTPLARRFEAAELLVKGGATGALPLQAMAVPYRSPTGGLVLPVVLDVPAGPVLAGGRDRLGLEIYGYALDDKGAVLDFVALASDIDVAKAPAGLRERGLRAHAAFALPPGRHVLRFLVRDSHTGLAGTHTMEVTLPPFTDEVALLPPLVMEDPARWLVVSAPSAAAREAPSPFHVQGDAFTPRLRPRLRNGQPERICLLAFDGGRQYDPGASFELKPALVDAAGDPVAGVKFRLVTAGAGDDGFRRFVLGFTAEGVAAGDYRLRVRLRDPATGRLAESFQSVSVE